MKHVLLGLVACSLTLSVGAQQFQCGTDLMRAKRIAADPTYLQREAEYEEEMQRLVANSSVRSDREVLVTIPIVFHIIHLGGTENISNEQILNQVELLNDDFRALNADLSTVHPAFQDVIGDAEIQFALPTLDPEGNCTNGIDRIRTPETNVGDDGAKMNPWPRDKYLNVWVVNQMRDGVAGYAYYPSALEGPIGRLADGIIILNDYIGQIGTGTPFRSTALSHEIGHYLNLAHVWGNNNGEDGGVTPHMAATCGDDNVEDTPVTKGWNQCRPEEEWADCDRQTFRNVRYTFDEVSTGSGSTDPTPVPNALDSVDNTVRAELSPFTATGVSSNSTSDDVFSFSDWDTGANDDETDFANLTGSINTSKYYAFTVDPVVTDLHSITTLNLKVNRNGTGMRTFAVRSSVNNYGTNLPLNGGGDTLITIEAGNIAFYDTDTTIQVTTITVDPPTTGYTNILSPVTFRLYAWNAEDASGTFELDDVQVNGGFGAVENVENYMEYSYCSKMFSIGQAARMRTALNSTVGERSSTWTEANLQATGIAEGYQALCPPTADFYARTIPIGSGSTQEIPYSPTVCAGTNVQFVDNSAGGLPTGWSWTFDGGNPATSEDRNPTVSFDSPGWKTVTLTASNANGSTSKTDSYAVLIGGSPNDILGLYQEGFENASDLYPWFNQNYADNVTFFQRTTSAAYSGNACAVLNSGTRNQLDLIDPNNELDIDELISPTMNLDNLVNGTFSFRYAYSTSTSVLDEVTEKLEVATSVDCGKTWNLLSNGVIDGAELINNGNNPQLPPPAWTLKSFNLPQSRLVPNLRFRFRYTSSAFSGNLYIDDINISGSVGLEDLSPAFFMSLYPNPTNDRFSLAVYGMDRFYTDILVTDVRGAVVYSTVHRPAGQSGIEFSGQELGLSEGMYLIRATNEAGNSTQKLIIGK